MVRRITTFKSKNLLGETMKEERRRVAEQISRAIVSGRSPAQVRNIKMTTGASSCQLKQRRDILKRAGLSRQKPKTVKEAGFF